jgi:hypothetical protein
MSWTHLVCSSCSVFRLHMKQLLAQHIPFLGHTSPTSWELPDGFTEPFSTVCCNTARRQLRVQFAVPLLRPGALWPPTADNRL